VQGTIKTYDETSRSGLILDDAAKEYSFDADSFAGSGVRLFRTGQRVKFSVVGDADEPRIRDLSLITL
jgi:cold shock CspA family protein